MGKSQVCSKLQGRQQFIRASIKAWNTIFNFPRKCQLRINANLRLKTHRIYTCKWTVFVPRIETSSLSEEKRCILVLQPASALEAHGGKEWWRTVQRTTSGASSEIRGWGRVTDLTQNPTADTGRGNLFRIRAQIPQWEEELESEAQAHDKGTPVYWIFQSSILPGSDDSQRLRFTCTKPKTWGHGGVGGTGSMKHGLRPHFEQHANDQSWCDFIVIVIHRGRNSAICIPKKNKALWWLS